jgi:eukaryotic-like serine/threonine-protein kinase
MQILYHVSECLIDLHKEGYVHRDLKPANVMWLPSQNRWTIIDFGCVAEIGSDARMGFSILYAAPEVVTAVFRDKRTTMVASTSIDAWSVGILAVELFSGKPPLRLIEGRDAVCSSDASLCSIVSS